jgi:hypothetical protein
MSIPANFDGLLKALIANIQYLTGVGESIYLRTGTTDSGEGRFWCLIARNGNVIIKTTTQKHTGAAIPADITLSPGHTPIYGDFKRVIIDSASVGILEVHRRPTGI